MLLINIPNNFISERKYIISIIFKEFLGISYIIQTCNNIKYYEIILPNQNKLIINDFFLSSINPKEGYLHKKNIPKRINYFFNQFVSFKVPIIYGNSKIWFSKKKIICNQDVFASSFFMLSRWEEYVLSKDERINPKICLAYQFNFIDKPIVDEYTEYIWNLLTFLGFKEVRKKQRFKFILTHDIDNPLKYYSFKHIFKTLIKDIVIYKSLSLFYKDINASYHNDDPYDKFDYFMTISEKIHSKSIFFIMASNRTKKNADYSLNNTNIKKIINKIQYRKHIIGIHSGYYSYNSEAIWINEYNLLAKNTPQGIKFGRQHYLNFSIPLTWQIQNDCGLKKDFSLGYAEKEGFRCGTCKEYSVFNILKSKKLKLKEVPLIVMDSTFVVYQKLDPKITDLKFRQLISTVKKYNGNFVFLWHNSCVSDFPWNKYTPIFTNILHEEGK